MSKLHNRGVGGQLEVPSLEERMTGGGFAPAGFADERQDDDAFGPEPDLSPEDVDAIRLAYITSDPARPLAAIVAGLDDADLVTLLRCADICGADQREVEHLCERELRRRLAMRPNAAA